MSAYPAPTDLTPIFNTSQFQTPNTSGLDTAYLDAHYVQYPTAQGNLNIPSAIIENGITTGASFIMEPNATPPTNFIQYPDGSKQYSANGASSSVLDTNNTWTGSNNFSNVIPTAPTTTNTESNDNLTTQSWVNTAIANSLLPITPSAQGGGSQTFQNGLDASYNFTIPSNPMPYSYTIQMVGCGGLAGETSFIATTTPIVYQAVYAGGQGGGGGFVQLEDALEAVVGLAGKTLTFYYDSTAQTISLSVAGTSFISPSVESGGVGGTATLSGGINIGGTGGTYTAPTWSGLTWTGADGGAGASGSYNDSSNWIATQVPIVGLVPVYTPNFINGYGGNSPTETMVSGDIGSGQLYSGFAGVAAPYSPTTNSYSASPLGLGWVSVVINYNPPSQVGGTNSSFIAYDAKPLTNRTKEIYVDKLGLVVREDITTAERLTTMTPARLIHNETSSGLISATIVDIINSANAGAPTLQDALTAGNEANINLVLKDNLTTPTTTNTFSPSTAAITGETGGGFQASVGDPFVNGSAFAGLSASTASNANMSLSCGGISTAPFFSPPTGTAGLGVSTTTAVLALGYSGQFTNSKSMIMDLDGLTHSTAGATPFEISTNNTLALTATDNAGTGKGISINKTTPNIYYELNTASPFDRLTIDNNGVIDSVSITNQAITSIGQNSIVLQKPDTFKSLDITSDNGIVFATSGSTKASLTPSQLTFIGSPVSNTYYGSGVLQMTDTNAGNASTTILPTQLFQQSPIAGYTASPNLQLFNINPTAGATTGVPSASYYKNGRNAIAGDVIASNHYYANNYLGTKTEFGAIEVNVRNTGAGNDDGSIGFYGLINGVRTEFFRLNGADSENNCFRALDMNGQDIKTSSGNLGISARSSTGTGNIIITPKLGAVLTISNLPTSAAGLPSGAIWNNSGVLNIV